MPNSVTAWESEKATILKGEDNLLEYKYPGKEMIRYSSKSCGEFIFNTNIYKWRLVSQTIIRKCNSNSLPGELESDKHIYYDERIVDIQDNLPKYLQGADGPLYEE